MHEFKRGGGRGVWDPLDTLFNKSCKPKFDNEIVSKRTIVISVERCNFKGLVIICVY